MADGPLVGGLFVVDDAHEVVVELCAREVGVVGGVVALAAKDGDEPAAFADGLEPAVEFDGSGAASVAEAPPVPCGCIAMVGGWRARRHLAFSCRANRMVSATFGESFAGAGHC